MLLKTRVFESLHLKSDLDTTKGLQKSRILENNMTLLQTPYLNSVTYVSVLKSLRLLELPEEKQLYM